MFLRRFSTSFELKPHQKVLKINIKAAYNSENTVIGKRYYLRLDAFSSKSFDCIKKLYTPRCIYGPREGAWWKLLCLAYSTMLPPPYLRLDALSSKPFDCIKKLYNPRCIYEPGEGAWWKLLCLAYSTMLPPLFTFGVIQ